MPREGCGSYGIPGGADRVQFLGDKCRFNASRCAQAAFFFWEDPSNKLLNKGFRGSVVALAEDGSTLVAYSGQCSRHETDNTISFQF